MNIQSKEFEMKKEYLLFTTIGILFSTILGSVGVLSLNDSFSLRMKNEYTVDFRNFDQTLLWSTRVYEGNDVVYQGNTPTRPEDEYYTYTFSSWNESLTNINDDTIFVAQFFKEPKEYKVTFVNYDYAELYVTYVARGNHAEYFGPLPARPKDKGQSYVFKTWDQPLTNVTEDLIIKAVYEKIENQFSVTFLNYDSTLLYVDEVVNGGTATYVGVLPIRQSTPEIDYVFSGWDKDLTDVSDSFSTTALFDEFPVDYEVKFVNDNGTLLYIDYVVMGGTAEYSGAIPTKESEEKYDYTFAGWNKPLADIQADTIVVAIYTKKIKQYSVTFLNFDQEVLLTISVSHGDNAYYNGETPLRPKDEKYEYTFVDWDRDMTNVQSNIQTYARYEQKLRTFDVIFVNYDGRFLGKDVVIYGENAIPPLEIPVRNPSGLTVYNFIGWEPTLEAIIKDTTFIAQFEEYVEGGGLDAYIAVFFYNYDGVLLDVAALDFGEEAFYRGKMSPPTRPYSNGRHYYFSNWDRAEDLKSVENNIITFAQFTTNYLEYIVTYRDPDGKLLYEDLIYGNGISSYKGPAKDYLLAENGFIGWSKPLIGINQSITVYPVFEPRGDVLR